MSRYRGPCLKKIRRLGILPGLTRKMPKSGSNQKKKFHSGKNFAIYDFIFLLLDVL